MPIIDAERLALALSGLFERGEGFADFFQKSSNYRHNGLALVGLSPAKAYLQGDLVIAAVFRDPAKGANSAPSDNPDVGKGDVPKLQAGDLCVLLRGQQDHVLVSNVEDMKPDQISPIPSRVGLYLIEDAGDDAVAGCVTKFFMSINGPFVRLQIREITDDWEERPIMDRAPVRLDQNAVCVIEGGPEIVERVAQYCGRMSRKRASDHSLPATIIALRADGFFVGCDMGVEKSFELVDVMFGPFGL